VACWYLWQSLRLEATPRKSAAKTRVKKKTTRKKTKASEGGPRGRTLSGTAGRSRRRSR
jgi:hypothetical protein